jgi:GT2 family glycosyltransferase
LTARLIHRRGREAIERHRVDVLIPTCDRPAALAATLTALFAQSLQPFRVVVSDQGERHDAAGTGEVRAVARLLESRGHAVEFHKHLPRRGLAEQRDFLLRRASAPHVLFLDDDVVIEADLIERMLQALSAQGCGFVGSALHGLSFVDDVRPHQQAIEFWDGRVQPETIEPDGREWARHHLHSAANLYHVQSRLGLGAGAQKLYRVAWVGGCVLYDAAKLRACGGFGFWRELPADHCGEDVLAQLRVMARFGGCGLIPSGAYHLELETTVPRREVDAPKYLKVHGPIAALASDPGPASPSRQLDTIPREDRR